MDANEEAKMERLRDRLPESEIEWRVRKYGFKQGSGPWAMVVPYPDARFLMQRLDQVLEPDGWQTQIASTEGGIITCGLGIYFEGRERWIWRWDAADATEIGGAKGGVTHAFRRCCVQWNVADIQFLYQIEDAVFANVHEDGSHRTYDKDRGEEFFWDPPPLSGIVGQETSYKKRVATIFGEFCESREELRETIGQIARWRAEVHEDFPADWPDGWLDADYERLWTKMKEAGDGDPALGGQKLAMEAGEWAS